MIRHVFKLHSTMHPIFHERINHRDRCHYVIDKVLSDEITTYFVKSEDQLVDMFKNSLKTKNLKV